MEKKRILVADDEGINRLFLRSLLQNNGWEVEEAGEGEEAVRIASEEPFDVILMDVNMPLLDGFDATRRLREAGVEDRRGAPVTILALSAYNDEKFFAECEEAGMNGILSKPITETKLLRTLDRHDPHTMEE